MLSNDFENLNLIEERTCQFALKPLLNVDNTGSKGCNQLPRLMKFMLISAYIATHNPPKYDRKLFEAGKSGNSRKSRFTAQRFQQTEDNQHTAAIKTQTFDLNRLLAIFFAICAENLSSQVANSINLSQIQMNVKTLKSLHYLQQSNSAYSSLDEPRYKCLIDFDTIENLSKSVHFNIKQYLAEYINL